MTFEAIALGAERISAPENDTVMMSASAMVGKSKKKQSTKPAISDAYVTS